MRLRIGIVLLLILGVVQIVVAQEGNLTLNDPLVLSFNDNQSAYNFGIDLQEGETYAFQLVADFTLELQIFDPNGVGVTNTQVNPLGKVITASATGVHRFSLTRPDWVESSGYVTLQISAITVQFVSNDDISISLPTEGRVTVFDFEAQAGDDYLWFFEGENLRYQIINPDGTELMGDGTYDNPGQFMQPIIQTGTHRAIVQTLAPDGTEVTASIRNINAMPITSGETIEGTSPVGDAVYFTFDSAMGKLWQLDAVLPDNGSRRLQLLTPDEAVNWWERQMIYDDGSGANGQPRIAQFEAYRDGDIIAVLTFDPWDESVTEFAYSLTLTPDSRLNLAPDNTFSGEISPETGSVNYEFTGKAGDIVEIDIQRTSDVGALAISIFSPEDEIVNFNSRDVIRELVQIQLPVDGTYLVFMNNFDYEPTTMTYDITLREINR